MRVNLIDSIYHDLDESDYDIQPVELDSIERQALLGDAVPTVLNGRALLKPEAMWRHKEGGGRQQAEHPAPVLQGLLPRPQGAQDRVQDLRGDGVQAEPAAAHADDGLPTC